LKAARLVLVYVLVYGGAALCLLPFVWMVATSLKTPIEAFAFPPVFVPKEPHWENYVQVWERVPWGRYIANTLFVAAAQVAIILVTSSLAAYAFARLTFVGRDVLFLLLLGTLMLPGQVTLIPNFLLMYGLGWINTYQALIVPGVATFLSTFLFRQYFYTIPVELEEAARVDGCSRLGVLWRILLPLSVPVIAVVVLFRFLGAWDDFLWPLIVTSSTDMRMVMVGVAMFQQEEGRAVHLLLAASTLALAPVLIGFLFVQKYLIEGVQTTGLK
jgi:multiple sugar transport system permease protein